MRELVACADCGDAVELIDGDHLGEAHLSDCVRNLRVQLDHTIEQLYKQTRVACVWRDRYQRLRDEQNKPKALT